jgi:hypothetical protein
MNILGRVINVLVTLSCLGVLVKDAVSQTYPAPSPAYFPPLAFNRHTIGISFLQSSSANWIYGEQNYFNLKLGLRSQDENGFGKIKFKHQVSADLGARYSRDSSDLFPIRTSENEFFAEGVFSYDVGGKFGPYATVSPFISATLRTPITESFYYTQEGRYRRASLWDPVQSSEAAGLNYTYFKGPDYLSSRAGVALYQTRANFHTQLTDKFETIEVERYKAESGIEFVTDAYLVLDSLINYNGRLELFSTFQDPSTWRINLRSEFRATIWKFIVASLSFDVIHNIQQTRRTQYRQSLMLGVAKDF